MRQAYKPTIDKEVYPAVVYLRNRGFSPRFSCSGHGRDGYILFKGKLDNTQQTKAQSILREKYGFHKISWKFYRKRRYQSGYIVKPHTVVTFRIRR